MNLAQIFEAFNRLKVLIVGDVMIDSYVWGQVERISPEAPVPIVNVRKRENRLGGAANVALNIQALGATPLLCAVVGNDADGEVLEFLMKKRNIPTEGIIHSEGRITTVKHRILAGSQHILRIDSETDKPIQAEDSARLIEKVKTLALDADVIVFEDYDKGTLTADNIREIISFANVAGIPTVVDPKKRNFMNYQHCTLFKPNLKELREGLKVDVDKADTEELKEAIALLKEKTQIKGALITLSELGVYIDAQGEQHLIPAHKREIADVSGAGDTVVSIAAVCVALGLPPHTVAALANLGGGLVCEHLGVVPVSKDRLWEEAAKVLELSEAGIDSRKV